MITSPTGPQTEQLAPAPTPSPSLQPFFSGKMPLPPSVNAAYKLIKSRDGMRIGPTPALMQFKADAALLLTNAYADWSLINAIRDAHRKTPLSVTIRVYFSTEWKRDLDGAIKYVIDAAFERIRLNDNLVVRVEAEKSVDPLEPRVEIDIACALPMSR